MNPEQRLAQLRKEANALLAKAEGPDFTEADGKRATALAREVNDLQTKIGNANAAAAALNKAVTGGITHSSLEDEEEYLREVTMPGVRKAAGADNGRRERAAAFAKQMQKALDVAAPTIGGPAVNKQLVPSGAVSVGFDGRAIEDPKAQHSLPNAINARPVDKPTGSYLRQVLRENNATSVPMSQLKPVSRYGLEAENYSIATIAHVSEPTPIQYFADYGSLEEFLISEMTYGLESAVTDFILNGGLAEDDSTVYGIMTTPGVIQTAFSGSAMRSIRRALGDLEAAGSPATGIVLNPLDWMEIELAEDTTGRFLVGPSQPTAAPARTLWNVPVTLANDMPVGQAVVGDLSVVTLLTRSSALLAWNPFVGITGTEAAPVTRELFRRNEIEARLEARVGLEITSPKSLRVVDLAA
ncbi:phage major capsid protein [Arthrobacter sp. FW306-05-C]|uniref:phage major capsid protein n=1 Tax=Arthrobacter sp. FW306-05-C TaxID=2879620 RepID=UPI001F008B98|nr:phage major capsid protein [Arthrobacter sp. FW306-05-C]UKA65433.1 phage major capsid protein [Arthrobacter sp. FW306-05-C]